MGLFSNQQVQEDFAAGEDFADAGLEPVPAAGVPGVEADGVDLFLLRDEDGPLIVETLADDRVGRLAEDLPRPDHGIQCPEAGVIQEDVAVGDSLGDERLPHLFRLVVVPPVVVAADNDPVHLPGLVEGRAGVDPVIEILVGGSTPGLGRGPQQEGGVSVGDVLDAVVGPGPPDRPDAHVAIQHGAPEGDDEDDKGLEHLADPMEETVFHAGVRFSL